MPHQLAHINLAPALGPRGDPRMAGFFDNVDRINSAAEAAPGFVWRLVNEDTDVTRAQAFPEPNLLISMSVWEDLDSLRHFVYKTVHVDFMRRRREWFSRPTLPNLALWWVPEGHQPLLAEARERVDLLALEGSTPDAFTFGHPFPPPDQSTGSQ